MNNHHLPTARTLRCLGWALLFTMPTTTLLPQVVQIRDAAAAAESLIHESAELPAARLTSALPGEVSLRAGLFRERRELTKGYVLRLKTEDLLQNHLLEAGVRTEKSCEQMHQGWESPQCQLRGHFAGHWLSAAAQFAAIDHDPVLLARAGEVIDGLKQCQTLNGDGWVGSIPEKYLDLLESGRPIWSPQYTLHKTMMGLFDAYVYLGRKDALAAAENSADWFLAWTEKVARAGHGEAIYGGECAGMLELWSELYGATKDRRFLTLASRYAMPDLFRALLDGGDPLSNAHANASIPWIQGAARLYEVSGDPRYREIVERFWTRAVSERGMFATTGNNAGEYWVPAGRFDRFVGNRTQEHCTVYNMIRVAQYLFRWTGDSRYADYIERALYNGILAQQNPHTGAVCYFLPLQPGAKKIWGSETRDFWCCHGTLVQAQALFEQLVYYRAVDGVTIAQFIPSQATVGTPGAQIRIILKTDWSDGTGNFGRADDLSAVAVELAVTSERAEPWTLRIRQPIWAVGEGRVLVDGKPVVADSKNGFIELTRVWKTADVRVTFAKRLTREPLPGDGSRFALLDGPVVLAALTDNAPELVAGATIVPQYEHQYIDGREWQSGHYWARTNAGTVRLKPLYEVADEAYSVYFAAAK
ncbi:MAG: glycoside hydrolase family 127 protein [Opitutaceae bacterium]